MPAICTSPPKQLNEDLELRPKDWEPKDIYFLVTGLIIPRPIGWISTVSSQGVPNLAPYSYFNAVAHNPPHVMFSSVGKKDSLRNVEETGEFVANIVTMVVVERMNFTSTDFPSEENEFGWAGLTPVKSKQVSPCRVREAKAHFECRSVQIVPAGNGNIVIGEVVHIHIDQSVWEDGRVSPEKLDPVCRLAGSGYARLGEIFLLDRPAWDNVKQTTGDESMPRLEQSIS